MNLDVLFNDSIEEAPIVHGLRIDVLEKAGLARSLLADQIFSPTLVLGDLIHRGILDVRDRRIIEIGCGTGLAGILAAVHGARSVLLTDYDDDSILSCPRRNVSQNNITAEVKGYTWGHDTAEITRDERFEVVLLADLLWYTEERKSNGFQWD